MATIADAGYLVNQARIESKQLGPVKGRAKTFGGIHPRLHTEILEGAAEHAVTSGVFILALLRHWEATGPEITYDVTEFKPAPYHPDEEDLK